MQTRIVLISDDSDFFEYIVSKLFLRSEDELFRFSFDEIPKIIHLIDSSLLIVNSENNKEKALDLLNITKNAPCILFSYNYDEEFKNTAYSKGMFEYFTLLTSDNELKAKIKSGLKLVSSYESSNRYRDILVENNLITPNNEVFLDANNIIDIELKKIHKASAKAVLVAISPDEKSKFTIQSNQIETAVLNIIRKKDIFINFAPNKYFLILYNTTVEKAKIIWSKITSNMTVPMYAGFVSIGRKSRQQIVNEALNNLHLEINKVMYLSNTTDSISGNNFKFYREEFNKKINNILSPVFYHIQQVYNDKLFSMSIEHYLKNGTGCFYIKSKHYIGVFKVTCPGFSTINLDISMYKVDYDYLKTNLDDSSLNNATCIDTKRITLNPDELEAGFLQDILEHFILQFKDEVQKNENVSS